MYKLSKYYDIGYKDGIKVAILDSIYRRKRKFVNINYYELKSKLYDAGYIAGYNTFKNLSLNINKNIV